MAALESGRGGTPGPPASGILCRWHVGSSPVMTVGGVFQGMVNNPGGAGLAGKWNLDYAAGRTMSQVGVGGSLWYSFWLSGCKERED